ncbi:MAG: DUF2851 family protein [Bacteroidota bacterium]
MQESFLHYVWQFQYFNKTDLRTTTGEEVMVFNPGCRNDHAGPDFFNARVRVGELEWIGNVEIHVRASEWLDHCHDSDPAYENVILHVVWKRDKDIHRSDRSMLPTVELTGRLEPDLVFRYKRLVNNPEKIPCSKSIHKVPYLVRLSMLDKAALIRLQGKAKKVEALLDRNRNDWEETCYQMLGRNFGFKVNAEPFQQLTQSLPYKVLMKHANRPFQIEALLFGQAGFLEPEKGDDYYQLIRREHQLLARKYGILDKRLSTAQWKFLRLRPANFPTIRLAQLAALMAERKNLFSNIIMAETYATLKKVFVVSQSEYWRKHYQFSKKSKEDVAGLGDISIENVIINTAIPLMAAVARARDEQVFMDKAVSFLQEASGERNSITRIWLELGLKNESAFDSQALTELYNGFCMKRRCLDCTIGSSLLRPSFT